MDESMEVQEGFLCPLCMKDLGTQKLLQAHFSDEHSNIEDPTKGQNIKGIFDKAKRKILGKGEEGLEQGGYGRKEELQMQTAGKELDFSYWEPQEIGRKILICCVTTRRGNPNVPSFASIKNEHKQIKTLSMVT
jgi:rabenosyn-5